MNIDIHAFLSWLRQPTTILGLAGVAGTGTSMVMGQITVAEAVPLLVGSAVGLLVPDNSSAKNQAMMVAAQAITAATTHNPAAVRALVGSAAMAFEPVLQSIVTPETVSEVAQTVARAAPIVAAVEAAAAGKPA